MRGILYFLCNSLSRSLARARARRKETKETKHARSCSCVIPSHLHSFLSSVEIPRCAALLLISSTTSMFQPLFRVSETGWPTGCRKLSPVLRFSIYTRVSLARNAENTANFREARITNHRELVGREETTLDGRTSRERKY